ncbi:MAG: gamma carbonic anhydrase family protein [Zetaproteobacteria bacterium]|nr:MAG: gamma carbonic anhydrase family protein [Zetaproteobacteria bacterium]
MIKPYRHWHPQCDQPAFVAPSAEVIGCVRIGRDASIWYQSVLRGDVHDIHIGHRTNIQDHCILHTSHGVSPCMVGNEVTVGHRVILHGCEIGDWCLIGMGAIVMDKAVLEPECLLAAGSLVPEGKVLRGGYLYAGIPARQKRELTSEERHFLHQSAEHYVELARSHARET